MKDSKTPKIVVGVGLAAMYGALAFYFLRDAPDRNVAATLPAEQGADAYVPMPAIADSSADIAASATSQPQELVAESPAMAAAIQPRSPVDRAAPESARIPAPPAEPVAPQVERRQQADLGEQAIADLPAQSASDTAEVESQESGSGIARVDENAATSGSGSDSQITAEVRTQIAAVAPASTIDVTTTDGAVELAGSVPSHEEANKVLMAARNVENVRSVDGSALMVGN